MNVCVCKREKEGERERHLLHVIYLTISVLCSTLCLLMRMVNYMNFTVLQ